MQKRIILAASLASLLLVGAGCFGSGSGGTAQPAAVTLEYWRVEDDAAALDPAITAYTKLHPHVSIKVTTMRAENYERELLTALAVSRGPDMFSIPNLWLTAWKSKLLPIPAETVVATQTVNAQKQIVTVMRKSPAITMLELRNTYVEGVTFDVIKFAQAASEEDQPVERIYGLPLSFDTLALFYNKDLFKKAAIEKPSATWRDVQDHAEKLTVTASGDEKVVVTSGVAIGGGKNVLYATDILAVLMNQNGARLSDDNGFARFNVYTDETRGKPSPPGLDALLFYQGFANPGTLGYSWNDSMPLSLDAFVGGRAAMYFGYPEDMRKIRERAPRLDFGVAPMPQIDPTKPRNIARYPVEVVSQKTTHPNEAWDFLQFLARQEQVSGWLSSVKRPTALRALITPQLTDPDIAPFAGQVLTGRSWYRGKDWTKVEAAFHAMIAYRATGTRDDYQNVINNAVNIVNSTY